MNNFQTIVYFLKKVPPMAEEGAMIQGKVASTWAIPRGESPTEEDVLRRMEDGIDAAVFIYITLN